jgi:dihydrofolate reductase
VSRTLDTIAEEYRDKAELVKGSLVQILEKIHNKGYHRLYIDGGVTIQNFLKEDLIDEITITTIPIVLGGGSALFSVLPKELEFTLVASKVFLDQLVQNHYIRKG